MFEVKTIFEVFQIIEEKFSEFRLEDEQVTLQDALGRITASAITATEDLPGFNRSAVDGYAVIAANTFGCSDSLPAQLTLAGEVKMGEKPCFSIHPGQAAYIPTGGELPENADAVVMIEYAEDFNDDYIYLSKPAAPGNNVVFKSDDLKIGDPVIQANQRLRPQDIGVLAALGIETALVKKRIRVGIIATGDEVVDIRQKPVGAQVRDVNSYTLYAGLLEYGATPLFYGIIHDRRQKIEEAVAGALSECDVVLISGGSSVGVKDETYQVIASLEKSEVLVHGIAIKPGKPTIIGKVAEKAVIGLPGHPASAFFIFKLVVTRLLDRMNGIERKPAGTIRAKLAVNYPSNHGREEYAPVMLQEVNGEIEAQPIFGKSGLIKLLASADGYVKIERGSEGISKGQEVEVILF
ncbi:MAG TPA: gephyrin-like molybdotransferase Glp [Bacillota bacterium]|nr:gephyrin-like molybdotransferase Glp [Bacillota bacterium]